MIHIALDLSTKATGYGVFDKGKLTDCHGVAEPFKRKFDESIGMLYRRFENWLYQTFLPYYMRDQDVLVIYEDPHLQGKAATQQLIGLVTSTQKFCSTLQLDHTFVHTCTVKKWATGKGKATKAQMMLACKEHWGIEAIDDNHADALMILGWAVETWPDWETVIEGRGEEE